MAEKATRSEWLPRDEMGKRSEILACRALSRSGYRILTRNYKTPRFEIDIVARHGKYLVFVEVRARRIGSLVHPLETLTYQKRRRIVLGARYYMAEHRLATEQVRFDVVAVTWRGREYRLEILADAFNGA